MADTEIASALERLEQAVRELERDKAVVDSLNRVGQAVARAVEVDEIAQLVVDEATRLSGAKLGAFFADEARGGPGAYSLIAAAGAPHEAFAHPPRVHPSAHSSLIVPVRAPDGDVVGALFLGHERPGAFTTEDERLAEGIAHVAGAAVERARLRAEESAALTRAEERANAALALEYVDDGVLMIDRDGVVRLWNRAAAQITALQPERVVGRQIGRAVAGWERIALEVPVGDGVEARRARTLPLETSRGELWVSIYGAAFPEGTVYAFRDVTDERRLEELRADVVATVSHELRTPVAAVFGAARTLRRTDLEPDTAARLLDVVEQESQRLAGLVDEILLTSQLDAGLRVGSMDVDPLDACRAAVASAAAGGAGAVVLDAPDAPAPVLGDRERIVQVLANLVDNALRYAEPSADRPIVVRLRELANSVRFEVVDTGPGVVPEEHERIFEKFYRLDPQLSRGVRGTGLGLYICRELVRRMHGSIGVESADGRGATFWFELPRSWERPERA